MFGDTVNRLRNSVEDMIYSDQHSHMIETNEFKQKIMDTAAIHNKQVQREEELDPLVNGKIVRKPKSPTASQSGSVVVRARKESMVMQERAARTAQVAFARRAHRRQLPEEVKKDLAAVRISAIMSSKVCWVLNEIGNSDEEDRFLIFSESVFSRKCRSCPTHCTTLKLLFSGYEIAIALRLAGISHIDRHPTLTASDYHHFKEGSAKVLLMSPQHGGRGLDLICANRIIFVECPWRKDLETQAELRCHRIGQTKEVLIQMLVMQDSFEEKSELYSAASSAFN